MKRKIEPEEAAENAYDNGYNKYNCIIFWKHNAGYSRNDKERKNRDHTIYFYCKHNGQSDRNIKKKIPDIEYPYAMNFTILKRLCEWKELFEKNNLHQSNCSENYSNKIDLLPAGW